MGPEEKERMDRLCMQIQVEQDQKRFSELCNQLAELLEKKQDRLAENQKNSRRTESRVHAATVAFGIAFLRTIPQ